jgi:hypothetical protein
MGTRTKIVGAIAVLLLNACPAISSGRRVSSSVRTGSVCVSSVPRPASGEASLANPAGSIQIDGGQSIQVSSDSGIRIAGLALKRKHLVKIRRDGKLVESFWFTFERLGNDELCLWYKSLYGTWSLWTAKEAGRICDCSPARRSATTNH